MSFDLERFIISEEDNNYAGMLAEVVQIPDMEFFSLFS